jgi:hypothetical protein
MTETTLETRMVFHPLGIEYGISRIRRIANNSAEMPCGFNLLLLLVYVFIYVQGPIFFTSKVHIPVVLVCVLLKIAKEAIKVQCPHLVPRKSVTEWFY